MLEPMTMAEHEGNVYCKQCYARKFGIRGVGFGVGAGALAMDTGDRFGNTESLSYVKNFILFDNVFCFVEINQIMLLLLVQLKVVLQQNKYLAE
jgi:hypothetical protein